MAAVRTVGDLLDETVKGQRVITLATMPEYKAWDRISALCTEHFGDDDKAGLRRAIAEVALFTGDTLSETQRHSLPAFLALLKEATDRRDGQRPMTRRKRGGRRPDPDITRRNEEWRKKYKVGLAAGTYETMADFARDIDEQPDCVRKALKPPKARPKSL